MEEPKVTCALMSDKVEVGNSYKAMNRSLTQRFMLTSLRRDMSLRGKSERREQTVTEMLKGR